ncbi:MAG: ECF transporter S component [Lachnospiraceae bacterium]|nr:ECF transporter S component [Lachnospiraceae bacterium]
MKNKTAQPITKQIAVTAILLAICILSQFLKNLSVYVTGPIVNLCLIMAAMSVGLVWGIILALITPVTAFLIAASPVMTAVPGIIPLIMLGNAVLVVCVYFLFRPAVTGGKPLISIRSLLMALISCAAKGAFMGLTIALWLLPTFIPEASPLRGKMPVFQTTFSLTQFITAVIGFVYFFIIWTPLGKSLASDE